MEKIVKLKRAPFAERNSSMQDLIKFLYEQLGEADPYGAAEAGKFGQSPKSVEKPRSISPAARARQRAEVRSHKINHNSPTKRDLASPRLKDTRQQVTMPDLHHLKTSSSSSPQHAMSPVAMDHNEASPQIRRSRDKGSTDSSDSSDHDQFVMEPHAVSVPSLQRASTSSNSSSSVTKHKSSGVSKRRRKVSNPPAATILPPVPLGDHSSYGPLSTRNSKPIDFKPASLPPTSFLADQARQFDSQAPRNGNQHRRGSEAADGRIRPIIVPVRRRRRRRRRLGCCYNAIGGANATLFLRDAQELDQ